MFTIDESIVTAFPGTKMGILLINGVSCSHSYEESQVAADLSRLHQKYAHLSRKELKAFYPIQNYVSYYKRFGYSYHVLAQLESVLKGKKVLHTESALLQAMFLSELDGMLLTGGHDLAKLQLPLHLKAATGTEVYQSISGKEVTTINGDMMLCDSSGVLSSILRGPDYKSRITASTTEVLFSIYAPPTIDSNNLEINLRKLEKRIKTFSPSSKTVLLQIFS